MGRIAHHIEVKTKKKGPWLPVYGAYSSEAEAKKAISRLKEEQKGKYRVVTHEVPSPRFGWPQVALLGVAGAAAFYFLTRKG